MKMYANTTSEGTSNNKNENVLTSDTTAVDVKVERESDDELQHIEIDLYEYTDQEIKVEMVVGHEELQHAVCNSNCAKEIHSDSSAETSEPSENHYSDDRNGSIIKLEIEAMPTVKEEPTEKLYADHENKYEMVIEPVALPAVTHTMDENEIHSESNVKTSERRQNHNSNDRNGSIIKLDTEAMPTVKEEPTEELNAEHEIKYEMVIEPVALPAATHTTEENGELLTKKPRLHSQDKDTEPEKIHECGICDYKTNIIHNLTTHLRIHSGEKPYSCSQCEFKFTRKGDLTKHSRIHTGEKPYSCSLCQFKCNRKSSLRRHSKIHTGEKPYSCSLCEFKCNQKINLKRHSRIHTGEKPYSCSECNYKCTESSHLKQHLRTHSEPLPKKPKLHAQEKSTESDNTANATRTETNTEEMTPKDCTENTETSDTEPMENVKNKILTKNSKPRNNTQKNIRNDKSNRRIKNVFQCNICPRQYDNKPDLAQHIESHDKTKRDIYFKCKECMYQSVTQCSLERHLKLHDKSRLFVCDVCGYRYTVNKHLRQHLRNTHSDKKTHGCGDCEYKTNNISDLKTHFRIHSGEMPYSCSQCEFKCNQKINLKRHSQIHTGEKPYSCSLCEYKCNQKSSLKRHSLIHTGEKL